MKITRKMVEQAMKDKQAQYDDLMKIDVNKLTGPYAEDLKAALEVGRKEGRPRIIRKKKSK